MAFVAAHPASNGQSRDHRFNKVCDYQDFQNPELQAIIRDIFPHEASRFSGDFLAAAKDRQYWETGMIVRALRHFGALRRDASLLGVGAGTEVTLFYLTRYAGLVYAADLYLNPPKGQNASVEFMLREPEKAAPYEFERERLIVQHMDARLLRYPDNTFDGIFSRASIEYQGNLDLIANAAYEMGRVLKTGGILTLTTTFKIAGPPGGQGWPGTVVFSREDLLHAIVEASGLEFVDEFDTTVSDQMLESERDFTSLVDPSPASRIQPGHQPGPIWISEGYALTSVHLALRKPDHYPAIPNVWAKPDERTIEAIQETAANQEAHTVPEKSRPDERKIRGLDQSKAQLESQIKQWDKLRQRSLHSRLNRLPEPLAFLGRTFLRLRGWGTARDIQHALYTALVDYISRIDDQQRDRFEALARRIQASEAAIQGLRDQLKTQETPGREVSVHNLGLVLAQLIPHLEEEMPVLAQAQSIHLTSQDDLDPTITNPITAYWGGRLSAQKSAGLLHYDAWYHIDFAGSWNDEGLFAKAFHGLEARGHLVLITSSDYAVVPDADPLRLIFARQLSVHAGLVVQVFVWQKM